MPFDLYDSLLIVAAVMFIVVSLIVLAIIVHELAVSQRIQAWLNRKERPIIDVWGNHVPAINNQPASVLNLWDTSYL